LQECDVNYEKNHFEKSLLLISEKSQRLQNESVVIPHATASLARKQNEAKKKGPKIAALQRRFEMVKSRN
jgi:hypothetical protein